MIRLQSTSYEQVAETAGQYIKDKTSYAYAQWTLVGTDPSSSHSEMQLEASYDDS